MEKNYQDKWKQCLALISGKVNNADIIGTWFAPVCPESYDETTGVLTLRVPDEYVYKALEHFFVRHLSWALPQVYGKNVRLQYRLARKEPSFADVAEYLQQHSAYDSRKDPYHIRIADARKRMEDGLHYFLKGGEQWLQGYDRVAAWLQDNKGRGLLCVGTSGLGKTFICRDILPVILGNGGRPIPFVNAADLHDRCEELKRERICIIDDLGHEPRRHYGDIDNSFFELCNNAERTGNLLIITTNLSPNIIAPGLPAAALYADSIERRYGREVLDRLKVITSCVEFKGKSLRA